MQQLPFVLRRNIEFQPFHPVGHPLFTRCHPRASRRLHKNVKTVTHGDARYLPSYM